MKRAFTLVELLVVITVIVVLLALLAPALDQAIYQAELAVCAARLDAVVGSASIYAMDHKRAYPVRNYSINNRDQRHIAGPHKDTPAIYEDERPILRGYVQLNKMLQDPLSQAIELEDTSANADVLHGYLTWYGWRYLDPTRGNQAQPGMNRLGDRFEWRGQRYSVLASDVDQYQADLQVLFSSHPDRDEKMVRQVLENQGGVPDVIGNIYVSRWRRDPLDRGLLDLNFAYADGSVERLAMLKVNDDSQTVKIPQLAPGTMETTRYVRVPPK